MIAEVIRHGLLSEFPRSTVSVVCAFGKVDVRIVHPVWRFRRMTLACDRVHARGIVRRLFTGEARVTVTSPMQNLLGWVGLYV